MKKTATERLRPLSITNKKLTTVCATIFALLLLLHPVLVIGAELQEQADSYSCGLEGHTIDCACNIDEQTNVYICGMEEHTHTEECDETRLICELTEHEALLPEEENLTDESNNPLTPAEEMPAEVKHVHDYNCYKIVLDCDLTEVAIEMLLQTDENGEYVISADEVHMHGFACYKIVSNCDLAEWKNNELPPQDETLSEDGIDTIPADEVHAHGYGCLKIAPECGLTESNITDLIQTDENGNYVMPTEEVHMHGYGCLKIMLNCDLPTEKKEELPPADEAAPEETDTPSTPVADVHEHDESCYETVLACELEEHTHNEECIEELPVEEDDATAAHERTYEDDLIFVKVSLPANVGIPKEAELVVMPITAVNYPGRYEALLGVVEEQVVGQDQALNSVLFYDISFMLDGVEVEPLLPVTVSISYKETTAFTQEDVAMASELLMLHFMEENAEITVEDVSDDLVTVENVEEGITMLEFNANSFSTYAVVLLDATQTGTFYYQVSNIDDPNAKYLIVSANGSYALTDGSVSPAYATRIQMLPVKGNSRYFTTTTPVNNNMRFSFSSAIGSGGSASLRSSVVNGNYVAPSSNVFSSYSTSLSISYSSTTGMWRMNNGSSFLDNRGGAFSYNTENSTTMGGAYLRAYQHMVIYKEVDTTLTIPADVIANGSVANPNNEPEEKPTYDEYLPTTDAQSGQSAMGNYEIDYAADKATSQIESVMSEAEYVGADGKVWADKSVNYGLDDYSAFDEYDEDEFSVTLSALTQQYRDKQFTTQAVPMDVVFVLDLSASMKTFVNGTPRAETMIAALNGAINHIMDAHPANRVGVVYFNDISKNLLPIDRYYAATTATPPNHAGTDYMYLQLVGSTVLTNYWLRRDSNPNAVVARTSGDVMGATYTQAGLQRGYEMFAAVNDTQYTLPSGETVSRTPVMILLSDGNPTFASSEYMNPFNGPHYGSGAGSLQVAEGDPQNDGSNGHNAKGIMGYYTILSAKYFKSLVGIHYGTPAKMGTVGMGIYDVGEGSSNYASASGSDGVGDDYSRAVLNPTAANLQILHNNPSPPDNGSYGPQLAYLLRNNFGGSTVTVRGSGDSYNTTTNQCPLGVTNSVMPVISNPYIDDFNYADYAFFGVQFDTTGLENAFNTIINGASQVYITFSQSLETDSTMKIVDELGEGMAVDGEFIIRYQGVNYPMVMFESNTVGTSTVQKYRARDNAFVENASGDMVPLRSSTVTVTTDANGNQSVLWEISNELLPAYRRNIKDTYYFEMLPIRLIFQVGLNDAERQNPKTDEAYYTNGWQNGASTYALFTPHEDNPYYETIPNPESFLNKYKDVNTTGTSSTFFKQETNPVTGEVRLDLGNNGSLILTSSQMNISVVKQWYRSNGTMYEDIASFPAVTVQLYYKTATGQPIAYGEPVQLQEQNSWRYTWNGLAEADEVSGEAYIYYVVETEGTDYTVQYVNNELSESGTITIKNTIVNTFVQVEKKWFDYDGRPMSGNGQEPVTVTLYRYYTGGQAEIVPLANNPQTLSRTNSWKHIWTDLPLQDSPQGRDYHYYVVEDAVDGYTTTYQVNGGTPTSSQSDPVEGGPGTVLVRNQRDQATGRITIQKLWKDNQGNALPPTAGYSEITVQIFMRAGWLPDNSYDPIEDHDQIDWQLDQLYLEAKLNTGNDWRYTCSDIILKADTGSNSVLHFFYYVKEISVDGYTVTYSDNNYLVMDDIAGIQNGHIEIINQRNGTLAMPEAGGTGTTRLYILQMVLLLSASLFYLSMRVNGWRRRTN